MSHTIQHNARNQPWSIFNPIAIRLRHTWRLMPDLLFFTHISLLLLHIIVVLQSNTFKCKHMFKAQSYSSQQIAPISNIVVPNDSFIFYVALCIRFRSVHRAHKQRTKPKPQKRQINLFVVCECGREYTSRNRMGALGSIRVCLTLMSYQSD